MNSTNAKQNVDEINRIFDEVLLPLAEKIKKEERDFFETRADPGCSSYYIQRKDLAMTKDSFGLIGYESDAGLAQALMALWEAQEYPELAPLSQEFAQLAERLRSTAEQSEEVSPFIYIMF